MENYSFVDRSIIAKDWHARGFSCGLWIDHAGREWSYQGHETDELFVMMSGKLELDVEGQCIRPSIGEEICIPAGKPHTIRNVGGKTARWLYGQQRESNTMPQTTPVARERSFHPEFRRKRRIEKKLPSVEISNNP